MRVSGSYDIRHCHGLAGAVAFPAHAMTLGPGDFVLLLGPAAAVQATAG